LAPTATRPVAAPRRAGTLLPLILLVVGVVLAAWSVATTLVLRQTLSEGRTVADMVENIGRWASQYGGVHVRTVGADAKIPGNFLTRVSYAPNAKDDATLQGARVAGAAAEREALSRLETYHWKNPALVQREVADVVAASGSKARFRLTARSVLNTNNAPDEFEREALDAVQAAAARGEKAPEYWKVVPGRLVYARSVIAAPSCLRCHDTPETAPEFIRTNAQFNGGGGYGYVAGQPAGLISVTVPMADPLRSLAGNLPWPAWLGLGLALASLGWMLAASFGRR
jgi:hypothetical protein